MLTIQDDDLTRRLQALADQRHQTIEEVLRTLLPPVRDAAAKKSAGERLQALRRQMYEDARYYWQLRGDTARANLTDEELDEQFWVFDESGIPRLRSEQNDVTVTDTSSLRLAFIVEQVNIALPRPLPAQSSQDILEPELTAIADRRRRQDGSA